MKRSLICCLAVAIGVGSVSAAGPTPDEMARAIEALKSLGGEKLELFCEMERAFKARRGKAFSEWFEPIYAKSPPDLKLVFDIQDVVGAGNPTDLDRRFIAADRAARRKCR